MFGLGKKSIEITPELKAEFIESLTMIDVAAFEKNLTELDFFSDIAEQKDKHLLIELELPTLALKGLNELENQLETKAKYIFGEEYTVLFKHVSNVQPAIGSGQEAQAMPGVQNVILVASGKGGVGKSTMAANFAAALAKTGATVGLLDADVYGPSVPTMVGIDKGARPGSMPNPSTGKVQLVPMQRHGLKLMSMGFLVDSDQPMVWRGPMIASACMQMFRDVAWGELDYLIVDLPPGTGDIHLTIAQQVLISAAVIVSTPQEVALADVVRAKNMFDKVNIPTLGLIENMSYFICDSCDKRHEIFSHGGAKTAAKSYGIDFLGEIPIEISVRLAGDDGIPAVISYPQSQSAKAFMSLAEEIATRLALQAQDNKNESAGPKISIVGAAQMPGKEGKKGGLRIL